ncbi:UDP-galactopyranose mutase [Aureococcus anophagefferens]|nr:UDP-galactopyranose mutase [Aureococcus anophagefferens]
MRQGQVYRVRAKNGAISVFASTEGILEHRVGYCGGKEAYPTYEAIKDHTEAVQVEFDPEKIKYEDVIRRVLDEAPRSRVFDEYRSAIFYHDDEQKRILERKVADMAPRRVPVIARAADSDRPRADSERVRHGRRASATFVAAVGVFAASSTMQFIKNCFSKPNAMGSDKGPWPHRAEEPWRSMNKVKDVEGYDGFFAAGEASEAPLKLDADTLSGDLAPLKYKKYDLLIVGAGLSGAVLAERCSQELGMTSLIIDVRDHIGGNCYDYLDESGIRCSKYGAHLFHTKYERVWKYVTQFSEWMANDHRVRGMVPDFEGTQKLVPIPPTQATVNALFPDANIKSEADMEKWYEGQRVKPPSGEAQNGEEAALSRVGPLLYERIFKHYTKKQWDKYPAELDASVLMRLPCRTSTDDRYFGDAWQALPVRGYTRIFENMLLRDPRVTVKLNVDFFDARAKGLLPQFGTLVYTGPIDSYFAAQGLPKLEYRSLRFEEEYVDDPEDGFFQEAFVVNHPSADVPFTRIVEYKHVPNQPLAVKRGLVKGTRSLQYCRPRATPRPVPNPENRALYERYRALAEKEDTVCFVGRLASYKYFNMDQAILNALEIYDSLKEKGKLQPKRRPEDFGPGDGPK